MSERTRLDIRVPLGALFTVIGLMLIVYGAFNAAGRDAWTNVNVWWGAVMFVFGVGALLLGVFSNAAAAEPENPPPVIAGESPVGTATATKRPADIA